MELADAWLKILGMEICDRFNSNQIHSILADLGVFKTNPRIRLVLKAALGYNLWGIICNGKALDSDILSLKAKLQYDGFNDMIVEEVISSISNINKPLRINHGNYDSTSLNLEISNVTSDKSSKLNFLRIKLGQSIEECIQILRDKGFALEGYARIPKGEHFAKLKGEFIYYNECRVNLYYNIVSKLVYKITIHQPSCGMKELLIRKLSDQICTLYATKYGTAKCSQRNCDEVLLYQISSHEFIEIRKNSLSLPRIFYVNQIWMDEAKYLIDTQNENDREEEVKKQRDLLDNFMNDI